MWRPRHKATSWQSLVWAHQSPFMDYQILIIKKKIIKLDILWSNLGSRCHQVGMWCRDHSQHHSTEPHSLCTWPWSPSRWFLSNCDWIHYSQCDLKESEQALRKQALVQYMFNVPILPQIHHSAVKLRLNISYNLAQYSCSFPLDLLKQYVFFQFVLPTRSSPMCWLMTFSGAIGRNELHHERPDCDGWWSHLHPDVVSAAVAPVI